MKFISVLIFTVISFSVNAQDYKIENGEVKFMKPISFKGRTAELTAESDAAVSIIKSYLEEKSYISLFRIEANVNIFNDAGKDQLLSEQRAKAVYEKLISAGVDCKRLVVTAFGSTKPVADNSTAEGKAANTNIKFVNAALRGHLIGGMPADGGGKLISADCN